MAFDYAATAREAYADLKEAGALVTLSWTPAPTSDAPDAPIPEPITATTYGAIFPYASNKVGTQPDSLIRAGDRNLLLAVIDPQGKPVPEPPHDAIVTAADGTQYTVKNCEPLDPAGVAVLYDITIRR